MKRFIYPAIFMKDTEEDNYQVLIPDLELTIDGSFIEEAYLYTKEMLKTYFNYIAKYDLDYNLPTDFEIIRKTCDKDDVVMLIDAEIDYNPEDED